jgi:hypothetical protein
MANPESTRPGRVSMLPESSIEPATMTEIHEKCNNESSG